MKQMYLQKEAFILLNIKANHQQDPNPLSKTPNNNVLKDQTVIVNLWSDFLLSAKVS